MGRVFKTHIERDKEQLVTYKVTATFKDLQEMITELKYILDGGDRQITLQDEDNMYEIEIDFVNED